MTEELEDIIEKNNDKITDYKNEIEYYVFRISDHSKEVERLRKEIIEFQYVNKLLLEKVKEIQKTCCKD